MWTLREHIAAFAPQREGMRADSARTRDLARLDSLYIDAMTLAEGDVHEALLALALATLPYRRFPAVIPLTGISITVPVSLESVCAYDKRLRNLPSILLPDTPHWGDRDKLPHFFGSAWLRLALGNRPVTDAAGVLVEMFEETFKLEGAQDDRDLAVDRLGARFAERLMRAPRTRPSTMFRSMQRSAHHAK
jgi:hypothetical protein